MGSEALRPRPLVEPLHDLAQHRVDQVGVVPLVVRPEHPLGLGETRHQLLAVGVLQRLPHVADGLALHAGGVRKHLPDRDALVPGLGHEGVEGVVEAEASLVTQRHHHHRGEGLGVGGDEELGVGVGRLAGAADVRGAHPLLPQHPPLAGDAAHDRGDPVLALPFQEDAAQPPAGLVSDLRHESDLSERPPRTTGRPGRARPAERSHLAEIRP